MMTLQYDASAATGARGQVRLGGAVRVWSRGKTEGTARWLPARAGLLLLTGAALCACDAAPRTRPLHTSPIAAGPGTLAATRQALEGEWLLVTLEIRRDDALSVVPAEARLTYDGFGNIAVVGQTMTSAVDDQARLALSFTGRVEIDATGARLLLLDLASGAGVALPRDLRPEQVRHYRWADSRLVLETRDGDGVSSRTVWRRVGNDGPPEGRSIREEGAS